LPVARIDQVWSRSRAIPGDRRVEVRQPEYGLVVRSLADRQAHHLGGLWRVAEALAPPVGTAREGARPLTRQVDPGSIAEAHPRSVLDQVGQAELDSQLIEVDVTRLLDRRRQVQAAMAAGEPAAGISTRVRHPARAGDRHPAVRV